MSSTRFNPPVPTFEEINPDTGARTADDDGFIVPGENDYAGPTNRRNLGSYLSSLTRGEVPTEGIVEYNGPVPTHGNAYPIGDASGNPNFTFTELGIEGGGVNKLDNYSNSGLFDGAVTDKNLSDVINKGKLGIGHGQETLSGHLLLPGIGSIRPSIGGKSYQEIIPEILNDANRNDPGKYAVREENGVPVLPSSRVKISSGDPVSFPSKSPGPLAVTSSIESLSKVAADIMLRSTGKDKGPSNYGEFTSGLFPSTVQMGTGRVATEDLRPRNYSGVSGLNSIVDGIEQLPTSDGVGETRYSDKSYGNTYNYLENFTDFNSGLSAFAALGASALAAVLAVLAIFAIPGAGSPTERIPRYPDLGRWQNLKLEQGSFRIAPPATSDLSALLSSVGIETDILQLLNFYRPTNKYTDYGICVILGFASFIGATAEIKDNDLIDNGFLGAEDSFSKSAIFRLLAAIGKRFLAIPLTSEKGYYLNIFREIMKDSGNVITNISDVGLSNLVSTFTTAKITRFIDTLAKVGDLILLQIAAKNEYTFNSDGDRQDGNGGVSADPYAEGFNAKDRDQARRFARQRIRGAQFGSTRGSHLGLNELPSAHLIPDGYKTLVDDKRLTSFTATGSMNRTNLRLKRSDVAQLESLLDAEYMPFYFQDLRTNELVAFHAFLDEVSDSYSAEYNSTSGYGRIEDIKMYKSTKRSVGCTFHVIATNPADFEYMWWQINKLTTMVYPQWSQGRSVLTKVDNQDFKFTQPFSQIPTATPVIRVRIGDLIRSNYSRFNLKRLFGDKDADKSISSTETFKYFLKPGKYEQTLAPGLFENKEEITLPAEPTLMSDRKYKSSVAGALGEITFFESDFVKRVETIPDALTEEFFKVDQNSIVKSFESTMGMGLASVVTQLQFTWMDSLWGSGDDGPGNRAPRSCKVQMSFEPIHDIAPGIDHQGFNRAPLYPVGDLVGRIVEGGEDAPYGENTSQVSKLRTSVLSNYKDDLKFGK